MMINKRLIGMVSESKPYIAVNVACQWVSLAANITLMLALTRLLQGLYEGEVQARQLLGILLLGVLVVAVRAACTVLASRMSAQAARCVKKTLREQIYQKLLQLGTAYSEQIKTSEIVQVAVEGVDQLETYFGAYLPQFFYAMLAPLTLFVVLCFVNAACALVLLICVPLIPVAIVAVQRWAKKLLARYWGQYTALGDTFLENLQGLTTLKIYQADEQKQQQMNEEAEKFRKITMRVLTMQLNSITIMDLIAYGGAALGVILSTLQYRAGHVSLAGCLLIILLSADFFIPMRLLGSYFHIAMNGMAASEKIFRLLDLPQTQGGGESLSGDCAIVCEGLCFSYAKDSDRAVSAACVQEAATAGAREILRGVTLSFPARGLFSIVGASGCGKSTLAGILLGRKKGYRGSVTIAGTELRTVAEACLLETITYIGHQSYLFKGSVRENLQMGAPQATDEQLWQMLARVKLADFLRQEQGLDTQLAECGANLSGGQRQRLALARALLHDSPVYIFDEATSNIDVESENDILAEIYALAEQKLVLLIAHRLANVVSSACIFVMEDGAISECGTHAQLLEKRDVYARLWQAQQELENYGREDAL